MLINNALGLARMGMALAVEGRTERCRIKIIVQPRLGSHTYLIDRRPTTAPTPPPSTTNIIHHGVRLSSFSPSCGHGQSLLHPASPSRPFSWCPRYSRKAFFPTSSSPTPPNPMQPSSPDHPLPPDQSRNTHTNYQSISQVMRTKTPLNIMSRHPVNGTSISLSCFRSCTVSLHTWALRLLSLPGRS